MKNHLILFAVPLITTCILLYSCKKDDNDNASPVAKYTIAPHHGTTQTIFLLDASESYDGSDPISSLQIRWDLQNDGIWDTDWTFEKIHKQQFNNECCYTIKLEVKNSEGLVDSSTQIVTVFKPCPSSPTITWQGQTYNTVEIGSQCWMQENLNVGINVSGKQIDNDIIEKHSYKNNEANCDVYGGFYQWEEMMQYVYQEGAQGICPDGWHIPSKEDWEILVSNLGGENMAGSRLKEAGTQHWDSPNIGATNESGFTALPAGMRTWLCYGDGCYYFIPMGKYALFWSSSGNTVFSTQLLLGYDQNSVNMSVQPADRSYNVRCIMD